MTNYCIVDIDGTLSNGSHRLHHILGEKPDWVSFMNPDLMAEDSPYPYAREGLNYLRSHGYEIIFLTGRNERHRLVTEAWLNKHMDRQILDETVLMRGKPYENTAASEYKEAQLLHLKKHYIENTYSDLDHPYSLTFFEDDPFVARMYRKHGIVHKAPECWVSMHFGVHDDVEPLWRY